MLVKAGYRIAIPDKGPDRSRELFYIRLLIKPTIPVFPNAPPTYETYSLSNNETWSGTLPKQILLTVWLSIFIFV
jgi:hypothetical protein